MCIMCLEIQKDRMTLKEMGNALSEFVVEPGHIDELLNVAKTKFGPEQVMNELSDPDWND